MVSSLHHFGGHVLDGAAEGVGSPLSLVRLELPAQPEVRQHDVAFAVQKNVLKLDITVDDAILNRMKKKIENETFFLPVGSILIFRPLPLGFVVV